MVVKATPNSFKSPPVQVYYNMLVKGVVNMKEESLIPPLISYFRNSGYITCTEYRTPWAVPDILAVCPDENKVQQRIAKGQIIPLTRELFWEILNLIPDKKEDSGIDATYIAEYVGLSHHYLLAKILSPLRRNNYIEIQEGKCVKINGFHPYSKTLVSIEAKVKDWKRAGEQALRHQKFVNQAYVALPTKHIRPALKHMDEFKKANLGLLEIDDNGIIFIRFTPKYRKPALEALYNVALDTLWALLQSERRQECLKEETANGYTNSKPLFCSTCSTY